MRNLLLPLLVFLSFTAIGQTPADWWYFGQSAGIHFETGGPVSDPNGALLTYEVVHPSPTQTEIYFFIQMV